MTQKLKKNQFDFDDYLESIKQMEEYGWSWKYHEHAAGSWRHGR